jgi:hypothetical protein
MGKGWTTKVWENLGWHHQAISPCGRLRLSATRDTGTTVAGCTAIIVSDVNSTDIRWMDHAGDAKSACAAVLARVARDRNEIDGIIMGFAHLPDAVAVKAIEICASARSDSDNPQPRLWPRCSQCKNAYVLRRVLMLHQPMGSRLHSLDGKWGWQRDCKHRRAPAEICESIPGDDAVSRTRKRKQKP